MGPQSFAPSFFTCTFTGCPSPVRVSSSLIASLEQLVEQTNGDLQGVLCGSVSHHGVEVRNCRPVAGFAPESMSRAARDRDVIGYYRVRRAESMQLTEMEAAIADRNFARPGSVVLLINRNGGHPEGTFFFRENGSLVNLPLLMFPLSVAAMQRRQGTGALQAAAPERKATRRMPVAMVMATVAVVLAGAGGSTLLLRHRPARAPEAASAPSAVALPLRAERQGPDLKIIWDLNSPAIASAVSGVLDIGDGFVRRRIALDERQVRFGSVLYTPQSDEVSIDFAAVKEDGSAGQASVLVLLSKAPGQSAPSTVRNVPVRKVPILAKAPRGADRLRDLAVPSKALSKAPAEPVKAFVPPPARKEAAAAPAIETLPVAQMAQQRIGPLPLPGPEAPARPAPPPAAATPPPAAAPPLATVHIPAEKYTPPEITSEAGVRVPSELRSFMTHPITVTVRARVDESGRVVSAVTDGQQAIHAGFLSAAKDAAMRCRFRPARRGDKPVASEALLTFHFRPNAQ